MSDEINFDGLQFGQGWHDSAEYRSEAKLSFGYLNLEQVMGAEPSTERPRKINLAKYLEKCHGPDWELQQLSCGSCVSFGYALAIDILEAIDHVDNQAELPPRTAPEPIYFASRVDIGGNRLWGAGSVGSWAAEAVKQIGVVPHGVYPSGDYTKYDAARCCSGKSRQALSADLKDAAKKHTVKTYAQVTTWDGLINAISAGYPCPIASNQGFSRQRDANGISEASGHWGHCMAVIGYDLDIDCALIANSWGKFFSGGSLHQACFYARRPVVERMLKADDTFSLSDLAGWPHKGLSFARLNW